MKFTIRIETITQMFVAIWSNPNIVRAAVEGQMLFLACQSEYRRMLELQE
jgi:hypothetical protein